MALEDEELPALEPGQLLLETMTTGVSAGTELAYVKGDHVAAATAADPELGLFAARAPDTPLYPVRKLGYMEVARVVETRTVGFEPGQVLAATYGHATAHVADPVRDHLVALPESLDPVLGVLVAHLGPICANALLHAAAQVERVPTDLGVGVAGRRIAVVGAGAVGLLVGVLSVRHGAGEVVMIDEDAGRRARAHALGMVSWDPGAPDDDTANTESAAALKTRWRHGPADHGADVVFQCRGRSRALRTALRIARPQGVVVDLAFYTEPATAVHLGAEFHHNGLSVVAAQIARTPRGTAPWWDRHRLSLETIALLDARGHDIRRHLLDDLVPLSQAPRVLVDLAAGRRPVCGLVFTHH